MAGEIDRFAGFDVPGQDGLDELGQRQLVEDAEGDAEQGQNEDGNVDGEGVFLDRRPGLVFLPEEDRVAGLEERGEGEDGSDPGGYSEDGVAGFDGPVEDHLLGDEAVERPDARNGQRAHGETEGRQGHLPGQAAELFQLGRPGAVLDRARAQEQPAFVHGVVDHVEEAAGDADGHARADAQDHVADLADGMVGKQPFEVLLDEGHHDGQDDGQGSDRHHQDGQPAALLDLEDVQGQPAQQVDAQELFEGGRHEGHEGDGGVDGRVGDPGVERHGPGLADGPDHGQDEGRGQEALGMDGDLGDRQRPGLGPQDADAQDHAEVAQAADDEGLEGRPVGALAADGDQPVQRHQEAFPEEDQGDEVVGQDRPAGQGGREEDQGVIGPGVGVVLHLDRRIDHDEGQEAGQPEQDEAGEVEEAQLEVHAAAQPGQAPLQVFHDEQGDGQVQPDAGRGQGDELADELDALGH